ncbi:unnamed protein product [Polarella glacialis]|nr:unnamed protein product [Polarella glacialis]
MLALLCVAELLCSLLVWLRFGRSCSSQSSPLLLRSTARAIREERATSERWRELVAGLDQRLSMLLAIVFILAGITFFIGEVVELRDRWSWTLKDFRLYSDARSGEVSLAVPGLVLYTSISIMRITVARKLELELIWRVSWPALALMEFTAVTLIADWWASGPRHFGMQSMANLLLAFLLFAAGCLTCVQNLPPWLEDRLEEEIQETGRLLAGQ